MSSAKPSKGISIYGNLKILKAVSKLIFCMFEIFSFSHDVIYLHSRGIFERESCTVLRGLIPALVSLVRMTKYYWSAKIPSVLWRWLKPLHLVPFGSRPFYMHNWLHQPNLTHSRGAWWCPSLEQKGSSIWGVWLAVMWVASPWPGERCQVLFPCQQWASGKYLDPV